MDDNGSSETVVYLHTDQLQIQILRLPIFTMARSFIETPMDKRGCYPNK